MEETCAMRNLSEFFSESRLAICKTNGVLETQIGQKGRKCIARKKKETWYNRDLPETVGQARHDEKMNIYFEDKAKD